MLVEQVVLFALLRGFDFFLPLLCLVVRFFFFFIPPGLFTLWKKKKRMGVNSRWRVISIVFSFFLFFLLRTHY